MQRFPGGIVFEAHKLVYHCTLVWRVIKQKEKRGETIAADQVAGSECPICFVMSTPAKSINFMAVSYGLNSSLL